MYGASAKILLALHDKLKNEACHYFGIDLKALEKAILKEKRNPAEEKAAKPPKAKNTKKTSKPA